jgi:TonB family protein
MLPVPSAAAVTGLAEVLEDLGFRLRVRHASDGLFITQSMGVGRLRKHGLAVSPIRDTAPFEVEVHAFVSRAVEPAHVHVDAIVITSPRADGTRSHGYSLGEVEKQVLDALEKKLGVSGHPIPDALEERKALASSLHPESDRVPCAFGAMQIPQVIPGSKITPMFPAEPLLAGEAGRVIVLARILSDGSTIPVQVLRGSETAHSSDLEEACKAVVGLWRYRPARSGSCPLDVPMTVAVDFKQ